jgi:oligoribonuclease NrnB/cAMP/cGMP phosphodiesterase (DHH superfamily)
MKQRIWYHSNCYDGFGAAWATYHGLRQTGHESGDIALAPVSYSAEDLPELDDGDQLYVVDFSFSREILLSLAERAWRVWVLDHHASAERNLFGLDAERENLNVEFDMGRSGAVMAWEHFFDTPPPGLLLYIQDSDLWRFDLPNSREHRAALRSYPMNIPTWDKLANEPGADDDLIRQGRTILRFQTQQVEQICRKVYPKQLGEHEVPVVNTSVFWSEVGHRLLEDHPDAPFVASYTDLPGNKRMWSLRSEDSRRDVSRVAETLGRKLGEKPGGGHRNAAGFTEVLAR